MAVDGLSLNLLLAAASIGLVHTLLGPDHYLPFVMLARARKWRLMRTLAVTVSCGLAHVAGSIVLGTLGIAVGAALGSLEALESSRGDWAAWLLIAFGVAYGAWGVRLGLRHRRGLAAHPHEQDGDAHVHIHSHGCIPHAHQPPQAGSDSASFWALLVVFVLGPCEPLIPLFVLPASRGRWDLALITAAVFGVVTVLTMIATTTLGFLGMERLPLGPLERWAHAVAGAVIACSGVAVVFFGL